MIKPQFLVIHHTASPISTSWQQVDAWHKARGFPISTKGYYIGYHYLIGEDFVLQARKETEMGSHTLGGYNYKSIGVCVTGNFEHDQPNEFQQRHLNDLLLSLMKRYDIPDEKVLGHRDVWATACPGKNLLPYIRNISDLGMAIENITKEQQMKIEDLLEGRTALIFSEGKVAVVRDNQKTILPVDEAMMNVFSVGVTKEIWDTIPTK